jgi:hypothetical protein
VPQQLLGGVQALQRVDGRLRPSCVENAARWRWAGAVCRTGGEPPMAMLVAALLVRLADGWAVGCAVVQVKCCGGARCCNAPRVQVGRGGWRQLVTSPCLGHGVCLVRCLARPQGCLRSGGGAAPWGTGGGGGAMCARACTCSSGAW